MLSLTIYLNSKGMQINGTELNSLTYPNTGFMHLSEKPKYVI